MGVPLIVVRSGDGKVRTFRNVCRHRGGRVEIEASGNRRLFTCHYHGWTYEGDGSLRNIPYSEYFRTVDKACNGLIPVATEERHGLVWMILNSQDGIDVAAHLGTALDEHLAGFDLGSWTVHIEDTFDQDVNWKLVAEGTMDVLHPKFLHPKTVGKLIDTNTHVWYRLGDHGRQSMARGKLASRLDQEIEVDPREYVVSSYYIFPNIVLNVQPKSYELWTVFPDQFDVGASSTTIRELAPSGASPEVLAEIDRTWEVLMDAAGREDWPMERLMQRGMRHAGFDSLVIGSSEGPIEHFHRRLAEKLGVAIDLESEQS